MFEQFIKAFAVFIFGAQVAIAESCYGQAGNELAQILGNQIVFPEFEVQLLQADDDCSAAVCSYGVFLNSPFSDTLDREILQPINLDLGCDVIEANYYEYELDEERRFELTGTGLHQIDFWRDADWVSIYAIRVELHVDRPWREQNFLYLVRYTLRSTHGTMQRLRPGRTEYYFGAENNLLLSGYPSYISETVFFITPRNRFIYLNEMGLRE